MPRANRGRRLAAAVACPHCGRVGHSSNLCPRDDYSPDIPALTCSQCVRRVTTATGGDTNFEIYIGVDPCAQHATHTAQPPTQAAPSSFSQTVASLRPPSYSAATSSSSTSNPTSVGAPVPATAPPPTTAPTSVAQVSVPVNPPATGRTNRSYCFTEIDQKYRQVVAFTNSGLTIGDALEAVSLKRRTFRRWRIVAEARLIDELGFNSLLARLQRSTLEDCCSQGKTILGRSTSRQKLDDLFRAGVCLRPMRE